MTVNETLIIKTLVYKRRGLIFFINEVVSTTRNIILTAALEAYLWPCQASMVKLFCGKSYLKAISYFAKVPYRRCLTDSQNASLCSVITDSQTGNANFMAFVIFLLSFQVGRWSWTPFMPGLHVILKNLQHSSKVQIL